MQLLEAEMRRLEAEYNMFFAGRLPRLPWESRARVEAMVKRHDRAPGRNTAERFRFSTLQSRFVSFCELWERNIRAREEGRPQRGRQRQKTEAEPATASTESTPETPPVEPPRAAAPIARERIVHVASFKDPARETDRLQELYERLAEARKEVGEPQLPYQRFAEVVRAQVDKLGRGEAEVAFRVALKDGKVTLTAKALHAAPQKKSAGPEDRPQ